MLPQSNPYSLTRTFNLLRYLFLFLGIFPFFSHPTHEDWKQRFLRYVSLIYCCLLTIYDFFITIFLLYVYMRSLIYGFIVGINLVRTITLFGFVSIYTAGLVQKILYYIKTHELVEFFKKWETFENEYENITGKQLKAMNFRKSLSIVLASSIYVPSISFAFIYRTTVIQDADFNIAGFLIIGVTCSIIQVTRLFTEIIWSMTMIALQNTAQQLMNDYTGQQRDNDNTQSSNKHYQYLWMKLTTSQKQFLSAFSTLYSCQMAFNTLNALFMGYNWILPIGFVYHMLTTDNVDWQLSIMAYISFLVLTYVYILMGSTTADLAQRAMEKETKEKLLKIIERNKQKQLPCNQEHLFLKNVTQTDTGIELGYYDKIDRIFFVKVLFASANTTTLITQFQSIITSNQIKY